MQHLANSKSDVYNLGFKEEDTAASETRLNALELRDSYHYLPEKHPIVLLEDSFVKSNWAAWTTFNQTCHIELDCNNLLTTNTERIKIAEEKKACNPLLLKINQTGTVTEAMEACVLNLSNMTITLLISKSDNKKLACSFGTSVFVSHCSGEATDVFIADLTVAFGTGHFEYSSACRGE
ncbi:hypothetical protein BOTCAL_0631g00020 [Botryotinia calthae]|uniref:phosphopyruvate hydratase n=1 Tax=Botryotinia calthae TaxID=38488 RepID=A0A4Y8CI57_9HELO|nr:hypothetical protein BOTCAL_0631g00020 [Botryotinia calthae]